MADTMTKEERSRCMAAIKGKDTKPELLVRRYLFSRGLRFRIHVRTLPGSPDVVLPKYRTVIFINGCFWHGHEGCRYFRMPGSNVEFWEAKISRNTARDKKNVADLEAMGWRVITVWECELRTKPLLAETLERLYDNIVGLPSPSAYDTPEQDLPAIAAEPEAEYS